MTLTFIRDVRKNVTAGVRAVFSFIVFWLAPVAAFAWGAAGLAGDARHGPSVHAFLASTHLLLLIVGFFAVCFCLERIAPYRAKWNRVGRAEANDWALYFLAVVPSEALGRAFVFAVAPWLAALAPAWLSFAVWPREWPFWIQVGLGLAVFDFVYYWYHRLSHTQGWLWAWHRLHHTPEYLVASKGLRHTFPEWAGDIVLHTLVFALLGMPPAVIFWLYAITIPIGILSHANLALPHSGVLALFLNLPQTHRIHHDRDLRGGMKNFSAFTMIWDHVFRTFESPAGYRPARLGTAEYAVPENLWRLWFSFLPERFQTDTRSAEAPSSSSLNPNRRGSLSRST